MTEILPVAGASTALRRAREARGTSLEAAAAATRIRLPYLEALEAGEYERLPAAVYARGYLREYALYLGLDPDRTLESMPAAAARLPAGRGRLETLRARLPAFTPAVAVAAAALLLLGGLAGYARHELDAEAAAAVVSPAPILVVSPPPPSPRPAQGAAAAPAPSPSPPPRLTRPIRLVLTFTEDVWVYVRIDGRDEWGPNGRFFSAGDHVSLSGRDISVTSGKGGSTMVTLDGQSLGALGPGVATRDFSAQT